MIKVKMIGIKKVGFTIKLPNGVTGFYMNEGMIPPLVDEQQFKQLCFHFAAYNGGKVIGFSPFQGNTNFYYAQMDVFNRKFFILLNKYYPYLACASVVEYERILFMDIPPLFDQFSLYYQIVHEVDLDISASQMLMSELNKAELKQIAYWKPQNIGQIIFNYWD